MNIARVAHVTDTQKDLPTGIAGDAFTTLSFERRRLNVSSLAIGKIVKNQKKT